MAETTLLIDDFGVNEGDSSVYITELPEEKIAEINEERAMVTGAAHMMDELFTWFDKEIEWARSIEGLDAESMSLPEQILAKQRIEKFMIEAKSRLTTLSNEHLGA